MPLSFQTRSPIDDRILFERNYANTSELNDVLQRAQAAQKSWQAVSLEDRISLLEQFVAAVVHKKNVLAKELTLQMGRPIRYATGEIAGFEQRAHTMLSMAPAALADITPPQQEHFTRFIRRVPLGVTLLLSPWNYPYLTAVNALIPAHIQSWLNHRPGVTFSVFRSHE